MTLARPCLEPGCSALTRNGARCPEHQQLHERQADIARGSRHMRGYTNEWARTSRAVIERDRGICTYCGLPGATTADHVIPKRKGGTDDPSNLVAAHRACNSAKGARVA